MFKLSRFVVPIVLLGSALAQSDPKELEAFLDGVMTAHLESHHIPGAALAVVKDGKVLLLKGYGYADLEAQKPVDPNRTLFHIGSVSKLFTWTAAMQLAEQGKLDLKADVNIYLKSVKVPTTYPEPITMLNLMAHNAGFEERAVGLFARSADKVIPLDKLLTKELPIRVRPPGQLSSYSNHGVALAGLIVSEISGESWEGYLQMNLLKPLAMNHTTPLQPVPAELAADLSKGYEYKGGQYKVSGFEYIPAAPAGALSSTAADMAHFILAHLQLGRYTENRILQESAARQMQQTHFRHHPKVSGMAHGFIEERHHGLRLIGHGGDTFLFHSLLLLVPEQKLGLFVSYNSAGGQRARKELIEAFLDRYYPVSKSHLKPEGNPSSTKQLAGVYGFTRTAHTTIDKLALFFNTLNLRADPDGSLVLRGGGAGPRHFVQTGPLEFHQPPGEDRLVFGKDGALFMTDEPSVAAIKLPWYQLPNFNFALVGVSLLLFLWVILVWPIRAFLQRKLPKPNAGVRLAVWSAWGVSFLFVLFWLCFGIALINPLELAFGVPPLLRTGLMIGVLATILSLLPLGFTWLIWQRGYFNQVGRIYYSLIALASLAMIWFMNQWNLLGFRY